MSLFARRDHDFVKKFVDIHQLFHTCPFKLVSPIPSVFYSHPLFFCQREFQIDPQFKDPQKIRKKIYICLIFTKN